MKDIINFFKSPVSYFRRRWIVVFVSTVWIFLVFSTLMPFGLQRLSYKYWVVLYFTLVMFLSSSIVTYIFPLIFKKFFNPEKWTNGKYFLFSLMITSIMAVFSLICYYYVKKLEGGYFYIFLENNMIIFLYCLVVSIVPTSIVYLLEIRIPRISHINKERDTLEVSDVKQPVEKIVLAGGTRNELAISPVDILYVEVLKNNITIHYLDREHPMESTIRMTLHQFCETLSEFDYIVKCHRAFVVNTTYITKITGNSRAYYLHLEHVKNIIPASKLYIDEIRAKIHPEN